MTSDSRDRRWRPSSGLIWLAVALPALMLASLVGLQMNWSRQADRAGQAAAAPVAEQAAEPVA